MERVRKTVYRLIAALALCLAARGQDVGTPVAGYVATLSPPGLRPIFGIPGAARLGDPLPLPNGIAKIRVAPGQLYALAEQASGDPMAVLPLNGTAAGALAAIGGAFAQADLVAFSPSGSAAVLYSAAAGTVQVLAGLPQAAVVAREVALASQPVALAISDDAAALVMADASGAIWLVDAPPQFLYAVAQTAALAFVPGSRDMVVVDGGGNQVTLLQNVTGALTAKVLGTVNQPSAAVVAGQSVVVASAANARISTIDLGSGALTWLDAAASPDRLELLQTSGAVLFSAAPVWFLAGGRQYVVPGLNPPLAAATGHGRVRPDAASVPSVAITGTAVSSPTDQPTIGILLSSAAPAEYDGTLTLTFGPTATNVAANYIDPAVKFSTGGTTWNFTVPAGATASSQTTTLVQGTVAGNLVLTMTRLVSGGVSVLPSPAPTKTYTIARMAPVITANSVSMTNVTSSGFNVQLSAYATTREIDSATYKFNPVSGSKLNGATITVNLNSILSSWYSDSNGMANGGAFYLSVPFAVSGDVSAVQSVTVTLSNSSGSSAGVTGGR
jgi:hypothetical protein